MFRKMATKMYQKKAHKNKKDTSFLRNLGARRVKNFNHHGDLPDSICASLPQETSCH
jgi:hypothetical protein